MKTQLKFVVEKALADRFKQAVLARRGKLDLSREGEEALRMYLRHSSAPKSPPGRDPLLDAIGAATSSGGRAPNSLRDKKALYEG